MQASWECACAHAASLPGDLHARDERVSDALLGVAARGTGVPRRRSLAHVRLSGTLLPVSTLLTSHHCCGRSRYWSACIAARRATPTQEPR